MGPNASLGCGFLLIPLLQSGDGCLIFLWERVEDRRGSFFIYFFEFEEAMAALLPCFGLARIGDSQLNAVGKQKADVCGGLPFEWLGEYSLGDDGDVVGCAHSHCMMGRPH